MATKTFDEFVDAIQEAYAMDINDFVQLYATELIEEEGEEVLTIYSEEGNFNIHRFKNETVEFNEASRAYLPTAYDELYNEYREISIRPLRLT